MATLKTPIVCTVIGEGGSGGALAIGVGDRLLMLEYSTYSVISPEGCASILWKSADKAELAAEAMGITSDRLKDLGLIDDVVPEPLGGGHRDKEKTADNLKVALKRHLSELQQVPIDRLLSDRHQKLMSYGVFEEVVN
jgi:acetyl-CoA carboxylase carboxyl transferase subunit alpha